MSKPLASQAMNSHSRIPRVAAGAMVLLQAIRKPSPYAIFTISATKLIHERTECRIRRIIKMIEDPTFLILRECLLNARMCEIRMKVIVDQRSRASRSAKI
jgi:hypothetical protein